VARPEEWGRFRSTVPTDALRVELQDWVPTADSPQPPTAALRTAPFWRDEEWEDVRLSFAWPRRAYRVVMEDNDTVAVVEVPVPWPRGGLRRLVVWPGQAATPQRAAGTAVRLVLVEVHRISRPALSP
jgi:hypothetical protein